MVIAMILTWIIPAGEYQRYFNEELNRTLVDPDSYQAVAQSPVNIIGLVTAIPQGFINNISIIAYVMTWGGAFGILFKTNLIEDGLKSALGSIKKSGFVILIIIAFLFSAGGAFAGIQQSFWAFTPVVGLITVGMGYDIVVAFVIVAVANNIGYLSGVANMWNVGVAQQISELELFSGMGLRIFIWIASMIMLLGYLYIYCKKIEKDPTKSIVYGLDNNIVQTACCENSMLSTRRKLAIIIMFIEFIGMAIGIGFFKMTSSSKIFAWLFIWSVIVAAVNGNDYNEMSEGFIEGIRLVLTPCIVIGMAGGILYILEQGHTLDAILHGAVNALQGTSNTVGLLMIYLFQFLFNLLVPSGTAQAATTMPIIAPLADMIGVTRSSAIIAFQFGDGFSNMIWPTACLAPLAFTNIDYKRWIKWFLPFSVIWIIFSAALLIFVSVSGM